jgi:5-methylcytosine-specific restriction endonuclease McrA
MKGFTALPDEFIRAIAGKKVTGTQMQVLLVLAQLSWGRGKRGVQVTLGELAEIMNSGRATLSRVISRLVAAGVVCKTARPGHPAGNVYRIETDTSRWRLDEKEPETRVKVLRRDNYTCSYCGTHDARDMTVDHVVPRRVGGANDPSNMTAACMACNLDKLMMGPEAFFRAHPPKKEWIRAALARLATSPPGDRANRAERGALPAWARPGSPAGVVGRRKYRWGRRRGPVEVPDMEAKSLPSRERAARLVAAGRFVCPIFECECVSATARRATAEVANARLRREQRANERTSNQPA